MSATGWYLFGLGSGLLICAGAVVIIVGILWSDIRRICRHQHR